MSSEKIPSQYEIRTIAEHAMRRLFEAQGRCWETFGPDDAQRAEWVEQALTTPGEGLNDLGREQIKWVVPRRVDMRPIDADVITKRTVDGDTILKRPVAAE